MPTAVKAGASNYSLSLARRPGALIAWLLAVIGIYAVPAAQAQNTAIPDVRYYAAVEELYRGDYQRAAREFLAQLRTPVQIGQARWIDSICYHAMLGETYFQMGDNRRALQEFDAACELFLVYPRWLVSVDFRQNPRPDANPARRIAPWGRSGRQVTYGAFPESMLISQGELVTEQRLRQGGPIQTLQMWRVNAIEVLRTMALAMRRRNEILGPLGQHDRLSKSLVDALARGGNAPRNHWSNAWTELLLGFAQQGVGESQQAIAHFSRAILVDGRYDHPLTGPALLGQARLALEAGNATAAANLATEASYAAFAFEDYDAIAESLQLGHNAFLASAAEGAYPPLGVAAEWARRVNLDHVAASVLIADAEQQALAGQMQVAQARLGNISSRRRELGTGRLGPPHRYVLAMLAYADRKFAAGDKLMQECLTLMQGQSLRNLQVALANQRFDGGEISPRLAVDVYAALLRDPTPQDWAYQPLETFAGITTSHEAALGRWLVAALSRKEVLTAIEITELTKRRRFWLAQPLGGRLLALRHLLEADVDQLSDEAKLQRRSLMIRQPAYEQLLRQATEIERSLAADPVAAVAARPEADLMAQMKELQRNAGQRETLLRTLALRRDPTNFETPPLRAAADIQSSLQPGRALVVFHRVAGSFFAFVLTSDGYHHWRIPEAGPLREKVAELLRAMGHFGQQRTLTAKDLDPAAWEPAARQFGDLVLRDSRLDVARTAELIVVPDGVLWHVPFEALLPTLGGNQKLVIEQTPVRYAPTAGFAVADRFRPRPIRATGIAPASGSGSSDFLNSQLVADVEQATVHPVVLGNPLPAPSTLVAGVVDQLVVLTENTLAPEAPYDFQPLPLDRNSGAGRLAEWLELPLPACERMVLAGVRTAAETGLKSRRGASDANRTAGDELFHASCTLLASGAKTVLISRWQTGGKTHRDLIREFSLELPHVAASEAWQRSVALARRTELDPEQEPRFKHAGESAAIPMADHPFLWAGYLLVDTGFNPQPPEEPPADEPAAQ